jgi:hypothetical protein
MRLQNVQELAKLNLSEIAVKTPDCLAHSTPNVQLEEINSGLPLRNYPAHLRIVQVQNIGEQIKVSLINDKNTTGKAAIRHIYEANFDWKTWLQKSQEKAQISRHPLTGYHCIDYVTQRESYLGKSWEEACQQLSQIALD